MAEPWPALQADAKTYIGLAAGLLTLTATFASRLIGDDGLGRGMVLTAWGVLVIAILCAAFGSGEAYKGIEGTATNTGKATSLLGATVLMIGLGAGLLAGAAWRTTTSRGESATYAELSDIATSGLCDILALSKEQDPEIQSFLVTEGGNSVFRIWLEQTDETYEVAVDPSDGTILSVESHDP